MDTVWLKPADKDLIVRDPVTLAPLPEDGAEKVLDTYWRRRIKDGDVIETKAPRSKPVKPDAKEAGE